MAIKRMTESEYNQLKNGNSQSKSRILKMTESEYEKTKERGKVLSIPLKVKDGNTGVEKDFKFISPNAARAIEGGYLDTYVPVNDDEKKALDSFKAFPTMRLQTSDGNDYGYVSYNAIMAINNGTLDKYTPANASEEYKLNSFINHAQTTSQRQSAVGQIALGLQAEKQLDKFGEGNIDLTTTPTSWQDFTSINEDGKTVLIPTKRRGINGMSAMSKEEAIAQYKKTGQHFGKFGSYNQANDYAGKLKDLQKFKDGSKYKSTATGEEADFSSLTDRYNVEEMYNDIVYEIINGTKTSDGTSVSFMTFHNDAAKELGRFSPLNKQFLETISDDEKRIYNYLYSVQGKDAAEKYLSKIEESLKQSYRYNIMDEARKDANQHKVGASLSTFLLSPFKVASYAGQLADYISEGKVKENETYNLPTSISSAVIDEVSKDMSGFGKFAYQTGMSIGDFLTDTVIAGGNQAAALALMGTKAAADEAIAAKDRGLSDDQAFWLGQVAGAAEVISENIGFDALFGTDIVEKGLRKYVFKNAVSGGLEEVLADELNLIADTFISGDKSQFNQAIKKYMAQGKTKAQAMGSFFGDKILEKGLTFAGGALSGGIMAVGNGYLSTRGIQNVGKDFMKDVDSVIDFGLNTDPKSVAYENAGKLLRQRELFENGVITKDVNAYDIGRQAILNEYEISKSIGETDAPKESFLKSLKSKIFKKGANSEAVAVNSETGETISAASTITPDSKKTNTSAENFEGVPEVRRVHVNDVWRDNKTGNTVTVAERTDTHTTIIEDNGKAKVQRTLSNESVDRIPSNNHYELIKSDFVSESSSTASSEGNVVGTEFRDTVTGKNVKVISRDANNTVYEYMSDGNVVTSKMSNKAFDQAIKKGQLTSLETSVSDVSNQKKADFGSEAPTNSKESILKYATSHIGGQVNLTTNDGVSDVRTIKSVSRSGINVMDSQGVVYNIPFDNIKIADNGFAFANNDGTTGTVEFVDNQTTDNKSESLAQNEEVVEAVGTVLADTLKPNALNKLAIAYKRAGREFSIEILVADLVDNYRAYGNLGAFAQFFEDGGAGVIEVIESSITTDKISTESTKEGVVTNAESKSEVLDRESKSDDKELLSETSEKAERKGTDRTDEQVGEDGNETSPESTESSDSRNESNESDGRKDSDVFESESVGEDSEIADTEETTPVGQLKNTDKYSSESEEKNNVGNDTLYDNSGRRNNESANEQTGQLQKTQFGNRGKTKIERQKTARKLFAEGKTQKEIVTGESNGKKVRISFNVIDASAYDEDMQEIVDSYKEIGIDVRLFAGSGSVAFATGENFTIDGLEKGKNEIYLRYDGDHAPQVLRLHEVVHIDWGSEDTQNAKEYILDNISAEEMDNILKRERYRRYAKIYGNDIDSIKQEFVADVLAGMSEYSERFSDVVQNYWNNHSEFIDSYKVSEYTESIDAGGVDDSYDESGKTLKNDERYSKAQGKGKSETVQNRSADGVYRESDGGNVRQRDKRISQGTAKSETRSLEDIAENDRFIELSHHIGDGISLELYNVLKVKYENDVRIETDGYDFSDVVAYDMLAEPNNELRELFGDEIAEYFNEVSGTETDSTGRKVTTEILEKTKDSVVKNDKGQLIPVYHSTDKAFDKFKTGDIGFHFGSYAQAAQRAKDKGITEPIFVKAYLNMTNPLYIDGDFFGWNAFQIAQKLSQMGVISNQEALDYVRNSKNNAKESNIKLRETLKAKRYDGIVYKNQFESGYADSYIVFDNDQIIRTDDAREKSDPDIRFSLAEPVEETRDLVAVHNLSPDKLLKSLRLGGLPMPSIAITRAREGYNNFGDISLVFNKDTIDPQFMRSNKVYSGDAWTPTYPQVAYKPNEKALKQIREKINNIVPKNIIDDLGGLHLDSTNMEDALNRYDNDMTKAYRYNYAMKYAFLKDYDVNIELPTKEESFYRYGEVPNSAVVSFAHKLTEGLKTANSLYEQHSSKLMEDKELLNGIASVLNEVAMSTADKNSEAYQKLVENPLFKPEDIDLSTVLGMLEATIKYFHSNGKIERKIDYRNAKEKIDDYFDSHSLEPEYEYWLKQLFSDIVAKEGIRNNKDLFTPSGNRRSFEALHYEHNLENVIKTMKKQGDTGVGAFGGGNLFGASTREYASIDDIKTDAQNRMEQLPESKYAEIKKGFTDRLFELASSLPINKNSFSAIDDAANMLIEAVAKYKTKSGMANYLRKESQGWANYKDYIVNDLIELVNDIRQMPVSYFEAKPQRAVGFDEIKAVIMPEQSSYENDLSELKGELEKIGVPILEYEYGDNNSRLDALNSLEEVRFSLSTDPTEGKADEKFDLKKEAIETFETQNRLESIAKEIEFLWNEKNEEYGIIPKGEMPARTKSSVAEFRYSLAEEDAAYMDAVENGDMETAQKMVYEAAKKAGYEVEAFHGTRAFGFTQFIKDGFGGLKAFFFTDKNKIAETYSGAKGKTPISLAAKQGNYDVALDIKNPLIVDCKGAKWDKVPFVVGNKKKATTNYIVKYAVKQGYDGVIFKNIVDLGTQASLKTEISILASAEARAKWASTVYAVFNSEQIKSLDAVTYDGKGNIIPLSKRFNENNNDIRYSLAEEDSYAPTFYSQMGKTIDEMKQDKIGANSVISYLTGKGVKNEEIKWSGIETFLEGKKSVTKAELQEFVANSQLQIEETVLDGSESTTLERQEEGSNDYYIMRGGEIYDTLTFDSSAHIWVSDAYGFYFDSMPRIKSYYGVNENGVRWDKYKLDGGENYREIIFKMPNSDYSNRAMQAHWGENAQGILAHARVQDMTTDDGKRMLFIEEIQSDWHNEGHKKGYDDAKKLSVENTEMRKENGWYKLFYKGEPLHQEISESFLSQRFRNGITEEQIHEGLVIEYNDSISRKDGERLTPDAPFRNNYHEYVLKSLIRMAAEQGYDSIGWTPSEIQSDRWSDEYAEGYRIEYDQDIPKFLKRYGKKWGAKVGKTEIGREDGGWYEVEGTTVWSMDITDFMKDSVLYEGQTLYSLEKEGKNNEREVRESLLSDNSGRTNNESARKQAGRIREIKQKIKGKTRAERKSFAKELIKQGQVKEVIDGRDKYNLVNPEAYNDDMKAMVEAAKSKGVELGFFVGAGKMKFFGGEDLVNGIKVSETKILVQYDHFISPQQIYLHEYGHAKWNTAEMQAVKDTILNDLSEDDKKKILSQDRYQHYMEIYKGDKNKVWEEFVVDTLSGMNSYSVNYVDTVIDYMAENSVAEGYNDSTYAESIDAGGVNGVWRDNVRRTDKLSASDRNPERRRRGSRQYLSSGKSEVGSEETHSGTNLERRNSEKSNGRHVEDTTLRTKGSDAKSRERTNGTRFLEAVKTGQDDIARRLLDEQAKKNGYEPANVYHGTRSKEVFTKFKNDGAIWVSTDVEYAKDFAEGNTAKSELFISDNNAVFDLYAKKGKILDVGDINKTISSPDEILSFGESVGFTKEEILRCWSAGRKYEYKEVWTMTITPEFAEIARKYGYDTLKAVEDNGKVVTYGILYPENIKSAKLETYDDNGKLIPLEERFNTEKNNIRYSLEGDGIPDLEDLWDLYIETYGTIPKGEKPARDIDVPKKISDKKVVSHFARTMLEAGVTPDDTVSEFEKLILDGEMAHEVITNKKALANARKTIEYDGFKDTLNDWYALARNGKVDKNSLVLGMELYNQCITNKDTYNAMKIAADLAAEATRAGQTLQACRMLKLMSPDGQLYYLEQSVRKMNDEFRKKLGEKYTDIELDDDLLNDFLTEKDEETKEYLWDRICQNVANQVPATLMDKWDSWRYLAMLGNLRTHIRNIVGNAVFYPAERISGYVEAVLQKKFVTPEERTKALKKDKAAVEFAKKDFEKMQKVIQGSGSKYATFNDIEERRTIFETKALEWIRYKNFEFLEREDLWFLRKHYVDALAKLITARGLDVKNLDAKTLDTARALAIKEAQAATYRDANAVAEGLSKIERKAKNSDNKIIKAGGVLLEGTMPFKKTPMNIAKQGVYYSPAGLLMGTYKGLVRLKNGDAYSANDVIKSFSKGLTGTGIMLLGMFLSKMGVLVGGDDEDAKKSRFDKLVGEQSYSLNIGGHSYTIDWMIPSSLPLFIGHELYGLTQDEFKFADIVNAASSLTEPLLELSVFSGINDVIETAKYSNTSAVEAVMTNMASSYVLQALPTISGQLSRIIDPQKREYYYADKTSSVPVVLQRFIGQASSKIPGASYLFTPSVDEWGREKTYGGFAERVFENTVSPGYYSQDNYTEVDKELKRLYDATGDNAVLPVAQQKYIKDNGEIFYLSAADYTEAKKIRGKKSFELINELMLGTEKIKLKDNETGKFFKKTYTQMSDTEKVRAIEKCYKEAGEYAKAEMLEKVKTTNN